jgi:capsular polysaccharide biosynthesis protein
MDPAARRVSRVARSFAADPRATSRRLAERLRSTSAAIAVGPDTDAPRGFASIAGPRRFRSPATKVVILTDPTVRNEVAAWVRQFPVNSVSVIAAEEAPEWRLAARGAQHVQNPQMDALHRQLKLLGPVDVIVDLMPQPLDDRRSRWSASFFHLKPGGLYVVDGSVGGFDTFGDGSRWVAHLLRTDNSASASPLRTERRKSTASATVTRDLLVIEKRLRHYLKLRDAEAKRVLAAREPSLAVTDVATLPAGVLEVRGTVTSHDSAAPIVGLETSMPYPPLHARHYGGKVAMVSHSLLHTETTVLPNSFRHHLETNPSNGIIVDVSSRFARIPQRFRPTETLAGDYYHLDSPNYDHYGHFMTEVVSRLWGWDAAKLAYPDLKAIFRIRYPNERDPSLERRVFEAYGIAAQDIVWVDHPVYLESVVAATPMRHNQLPFHVHPRIKQVWRRLTDNLADTSAPEHPKIFVSRQSNEPNRHCRNAKAVEALFAANGFEVIYPELFDLSVQAGIFSKARVVAGFAGSAMFNIMHSHDATTMIVLSHEAYTARNEHLFAAVIGCDSHYFWSQPDEIALPELGARMGETKGYFSDWEFDFDRNLGELEKLLASC